MLFGVGKLGAARRSADVDFILRMTISAAEVTSGDTSNDDTLSLTFTANAATSNFVAGDITVTNGTISSFSGSGTTYTATFTPTADGATTVQVLADKFTDASANSNVASAVFNWTYDGTSPTMTITAAEVSDGDTSDDSTLSLTFTSSESTTNFVAGDITVTNGTISNFAGSGTTYTATFTPTAEGATTIDVAAGAYTDAVGNNNLAATQFNWTYSTAVGDVSASILVVAGGGGGGKRHGGGGGAGGLVLADVTQLSSGTTYTVTVGAGGAGGGTGSTPTKAANGTNSTFFGFTALGGGGGSSFNGSPDGLASDGGSGGGGAKDSPASVADETGASGTQPSQSQPYTTIHNAGNDGGDAITVASGEFPGAGGGGAGAAGQDTSASVTGGDGGDGLQVSIEHVSNGVTVTANGDAQISTAQSKFGGASLLLDGTGDYLSIPSSYNSVFSFTGDFTIEMWANADSLSSFRLLISNWSNGLYFGFNGEDILRVLINGTLITSGDPNVTTGSWNHYALVRSGTDVKIFANGTQVGSTGTASGTVNCTQTTTIGANSGSGTPTQFFDGYMDEVRISNTARYTANFTPTTSAFTDDSNTLLLLHKDGDNASTTFNNDAKHRLPVAVSAVGNAQVSTAQSKFGGASALFDGTGDYLDLTGPNMGSGEWTLECFVRSDDVTATTIIYDDREPGSGNDTAGDALFYVANTSLIFYSNGSSRITNNSITVNNTWYHVAVVRDSSNNIKMYVDGTNVGSTYSDSSTYAQPDGTGRIGHNHDGSGFDWSGYIDEFRISNTARYTSAFTPQRSAFENDANTLLLLHMDGTNGSTSFPDDNSGFYYAGGGGGAGHKTIASIFGAGGLGGGSAGTADDDEPSDATPNTGGGGGGARSDPDTLLIEGGDGGSGIVVIRTTSTATATTGSPTVTTDGSDNIYKYTGSGSITF